MSCNSSINAAQLDKRIIIQSKTVTTGSDGSLSDSWTDDATVCVQFMKAASREFLAAQQVNSDVTHVLKFRFREGVTASHRLKFGTRIMNIAGPPINTEERGDEMIITAIEEV